MIEGEINDPF